MCTNVYVNERKSVRPLPIPGGLVLHFENGFTRLWLLPVLGLFSWNRTNRWYFTLPVQPSYPALHSSLLLSSCLLVLYCFFFSPPPQKLHLVCSLAQSRRCNNRLFIREERDKRRDGDMQRRCDERGSFHPRIQTNLKECDDPHSCAHIGWEFTINQCNCIKESRPWGGLYGQVCKNKEPLL